LAIDKIVLHIISKVLNKDTWKYFLPCESRLPTLNKVHGQILSIFSFSVLLLLSHVYDVLPFGVINNY